MNVLNDILTTKELCRRSKKMVRESDRQQILSDSEMMKKYKLAIQLTNDCFQKRNDLENRESIKMMAENEMKGYFNDIKKQSEIYVIEQLKKIESQRPEIYTLNFNKGELDQQIAKQKKELLDRIIEDNQKFIRMVNEA